VRFSPSVHARVLELIDELDHGDPGIASIWREAGHRARAENLLQPSYSTVRNIVVAQREERALAYSRAKRAAILAGEFLFNTRDRMAIARNVYDRADLEWRRELYKRRS
jgi:hypothetical protein